MIVKTGLKQVQRQLRQLRDLPKDRRFRLALEREADEVLRRAKELVPVKTGRLRDSGEIRKTDSASGTTYEIQFGGPKAPYGLLVHERPGGRGWKFLHRAAQERKPGMAQRIARKVEAALKRILR